MNCLSYVLAKGLAERRAGRRWGYLMIRRSYLAREFGITSPWHPASWVPHFLHRDQDHRVTQYVPTEAQRAINARRGVWRSLLGLWRFEGEIVGDDGVDAYRRQAAAP